MNRNGHIIFSEFFLIIALFFIIMYLTQVTPLLTVGASILVFLLGVCAPDLDHPQVQRKVHLKWLGRHTRHRGHFHSITGMIVYGLIVSAATFFILTYWLVPVVFGMFGYFSHLLEDDLNSLVKNTKRSGIKIW